MPIRGRYDLPKVRQLRWCQGGGMLSMLVGIQLLLLLMLPLFVFSAEYLHLLHVKSSLASKTEIASYQLISDLALADLSNRATTATRDYSETFDSYLSELLSEDERWRYQNIAANADGYALNVYFEYQYDILLMHRVKTLVCAQTYQIPQNY
ncbi:MAG: hypothetical protein PWP38_1976 [Clostridiales bacterium]|nr:hypothetical protein [Clostridiales bacterium]